MGIRPLKTIYKGHAPYCPGDSFGSEESLGLRYFKAIEGRSLELRGIRAAVSCPPRRIDMGKQGTMAEKGRQTRVEPYGFL